MKNFTLIHVLEEIEKEFHKDEILFFDNSGCFRFYESMTDLTKKKESFGNFYEISQEKIWDWSGQDIYINVFGAWIKVFSIKHRN